MRISERNKTYTFILLVALDTLLIMLAGGLALLTRFDFSFVSVPSEYSHLWLYTLPIQLIVSIGVLCALHMYGFVWRCVGVNDVVRMLGAVSAAYVLSFAAVSILGLRLPLGVTFLGFVYQIIFLVGYRCTPRIYAEVTAHMINHRSGGERIMLIGAGAAGRLLAREIGSSEKMSGKVCCIIDDDPAKWGSFMDGAKIVGGCDSILANVQKYAISQIIYAIPSAPPRRQREILELCKDTGCKVRRLPGIYQMVDGRFTLSDVRDMRIEDLLGRDPVQMDTRSIRALLRDKVVLVTGGGGSIGSELCVQIAQYRPKTLIILDIYENNAYDIQQKLTRIYGNFIDLQVEIASIRDKEKVYDLFAKYRPEIVFHAAAHKHVPLMERCPGEAIKNNIFGTYHVVRASEKFGVKKFVMISTDKAVNPTNFMGATKRFCEMILQSRDGGSTVFCAVRFGNVLGSNGSVVPLFQRQIAEGGPVTITDKRVIRYFMTIPEAAQLVLEAGAMAQHRQIFVLDMGEPVRILDLAENMIRLSGLEPYQDIQIKEIGLRPGEKLYEELLIGGNRLTSTPNRKIFIEQQDAIDQLELRRNLILLDKALQAHKPDDELIRLMKKMVPAYLDPEQINGRAIRSAGESPDDKGAGAVAAMSGAPGGRG